LSSAAVEKELLSAELSSAAVEKEQQAVETCQPMKQLV
jgi:hypothetical protein